MLHHLDKLEKYLIIQKLEILSGLELSGILKPKTEDLESIKELLMDTNISIANSIMALNCIRKD
jgi:hypothetical protein